MLLLLQKTVDQMCVIGTVCFAGWNHLPLPLFRIGCKVRAFTSLFYLVLPFLEIKRAFLYFYQKSIFCLDTNSKLLTKVILRITSLFGTCLLPPFSPCLHARQMVDVCMGRASMSSSRKAVMNKSGPGGTALTVNIDAGDEYIPARRETLSRSLGLGEFW